MNYYIFFSSCPIPFETFGRLKVNVCNKCLCITKCVHQRGSQNSPLSRVATCQLTVPVRVQQNSSKIMLQNMPFASVVKCYFTKVPWNSGSQDVVQKKTTGGPRYSANLLIHNSKLVMNDNFLVKMDFLSANSRFLVQNDGMYLPRITRETCTSLFYGRLRVFQGFLKLEKVLLVVH